MIQIDRTNPIQFGHTLDYLDGILNVTYLNRLDEKIERWEQPTYAVNYLDFNIEKLESEEQQQQPFGSSPFAEFSSMSTISIVAKTKTVEKESSVINCPVGKDPVKLIRSNISKHVMRKLHELSVASKEKFNSTFPKGIDLVLTGNTKTDKRSLIARILMASNTIATKSRMGPATFVMIGKDYLDYLQSDVPEDVDFFDSAQLSFSNLSNLKIVVSNSLGNTVIVGRCPKEADCGLHILTTDSDISGTLVHMDKDENCDVEVTYQIYTVGNNPENNYIQFDING
jgi:hypothetical protein